jgi:hypothetical protein
VCHAKEGEIIDLHVPPVSFSKSNGICKYYFDAVDLGNQMKGMGLVIYFHPPRLQIDLGNQMKGLGSVICFPPSS